MDGTGYHIFTQFFASFSIIFFMAQSVLATRLVMSPNDDDFLREHSTCCHPEKGARFTNLATHPSMQSM
jgi:hypothetical protein